MLKSVGKPYANVHLPLITLAVRAMADKLMALLPPMKHFCMTAGRLFVGGINC